MKTAHTEWFNKLPDDWSAIPIKYGFRWIGSGTTPPSDETKYYGGTIPWVNTSELRENIVFSTEKQLTTESIDEFSALKIYPVDTVLLAMYGATIGRVAILGIPATVNQAVCALADPSKFISRFVFYGLQASREYLATLASGGGQPNLNAEKVRDHKLPCPPIDIQRRIADYLDAETAQIDTLIAEKERMLALLAEKRTALVSQAVTQGLDPSVPMKPSGLEWLGKIPAHWQVMRSKQLFSVRDERSEFGDEELLTVSHITGVTLRSEKEVFMFKAESNVGYKLCYPGDLAINTLWAWMGAMGVANQLGIVSPDYHVYVSKGKLLPAFIEVLCRSKPFIAEVVRYSKGVWSSRLRLYPEAFFEIYFPVPPKDEQQAIVSALTQERSRTAELEASLQQSLALLKERRSALITAAVTGQLDQERIVR